MNAIQGPMTNQGDANRTSKNALLHGIPQGVRDRARSYITERTCRWAMSDTLQARRSERGRDRQGPDERARHLGQSVIRHGPYIASEAAKLRRGGEKEHFDWEQLPSCPFRGVASHQGSELGR